MSVLDQLKGINKDNWKEVLVQFIKFGIIGASNTLVSTSIYYVFIWIDPKLYFLGNVVGWIVSVFNSFYWNNRRKLYCRQHHSGDHSQWPGCIGMAGSLD